MPEYLNVRIPLITIRVVLIFLALVAVSTIFLFPLSFFSFNYFYNYLIPIKTQQISLKNQVNYHHGSPFIILSSPQNPVKIDNLYHERSAATQLIPDIRYEFELQFLPYVNDFNVISVSYRASILPNDLIEELMDRQCFWSVSWGVTHCVESQDLEKALTSSIGSFLMKNDAIETRVSDLLPSFITWGLPPIVQEFGVLDHSSITLNLFDNPQFTIEEIEKYDNYSVVIEFDKTILIDGYHSQLKLTAALQGIMYYLYKYRILSYVFGTLILWLISSAVLVSTVLILILLRELNSTPKTYTQRGKSNDNVLRLSKDDDGNYEGKDVLNNIDFKMSVQEATQSIDKSDTSISKGVYGN